MLWRTRALLILGAIGAAATIYWHVSRFDSIADALIGPAKIIGFVAAAIIVAGFFVWAIFFSPRVKPVVGGRLIVVHPQGSEYEPIELYRFGSRVTIGSKGLILLDSTLSPDVVGIAGEIRARVRGQRVIVRTLWIRAPGNKLREVKELRHKDTFSLGLFQIRYENTAAQE